VDCHQLKKDVQSNKDFNLQKTKKNPDKELTKFHEIELEKIYEAILSTKNMRLQMASFFGTANLAALSLAFSTRRASLFIFSAFLIWSFVILDGRSRRSVIAYYYRMLKMGQNYSTDDGFYFNFTPGSELDYVRKLMNKKTEEDQIEGLRKIPLRNQSVSAFWFPLLASIVEIVIGIIFWIFLGWQLY